MLAQITGWLINYVYAQRTKRVGGGGSWQSQRKSYTWKIELYCEFDAFFNSVHCSTVHTGQQKAEAKPYKVEVSEDRTQARQNSL